MKEQLIAAALSTGRVFLAASLGAYLTLGKAPDDLGLTDLKGFLYAGVAAVLLTAANWLRKGETRFGRGADEATQ